MTTITAPARTHFAHPTAVVDPGASIGEDTRIWHFCHVYPGAVIGSGCILGQNVMVADGVVIGDHFPEMVGGSRASVAYTFGHIKALKQRADAEFST